MQEQASRSDVRAALSGISQGLNAQAVRFGYGWAFSRFVLHSPNRYVPSL